MIENLFRNPKKFMECENIQVLRRCGHFHADKYDPKTGFFLYKMEREMPLFDLKCALNQPKMVSKTPEFYT